MDLLTGPMVRAARVLLDWRQKDLADAIGSAEITIRFYENGRSQTEKTSRAIEEAYRAAGITFSSRNGVVRITMDTSVEVPDPVPSLGDD